MTKAPPPISVWRGIGGLVIRFLPSAAFLGFMSKTQAGFGFGMQLFALLVPAVGFGLSMAILLCCLLVAMAGLLSIGSYMARQLLKVEV